MSNSNIIIMKKDNYAAQQAVSPMPGTFLNRNLLFKLANS